MADLDHFHRHSNISCGDFLAGGLGSGDGAGAKGGDKASEIEGPITLLILVRSEHTLYHLKENFILISDLSLNLLYIIKIFIKAPSR